MVVGETVVHVTFAVRYKTDVKPDFITAGQGQRGVRGGGGKKEEEKEAGKGGGEGKVLNRR